MPSPSFRAILSICLLAPAFAMAHEPPSGLLAHLPMDGDLSDRSGYGYSAKFIQAGGLPADGKLEFVEGKYGGSVRFGDGTTAIRIPLDMHPEVYPQATVTFWAYAESAGADTYLVSNGGYSGPIIMYTGRQVQAHAIRSMARQRDVFRPGRWMFIAGVWDHAAGKVRLHVGRRVAEAEYDPEGAKAANTAKADLWLGAYDDRLGRPAKGIRIDDLRIYGRALSEEEIEGLAIGQAPAPGGTAISSNDVMQPGQPQYGDITLEGGEDGSSLSDAEAIQQIREAQELASTTESDSTGTASGASLIGTLPSTSDVESSAGTQVGDGSIDVGSTELGRMLEEAGPSTAPATESSDNTTPQLVGWRLSSSEKIEAGLSGSAGGIQTPIELPTNTRFNYLRIREHNDVPCFVDIRGIADGDQMQEIVSECGKAGVELRELRVQLGPAIITGLTVCQNRFENKRVKGIKISGNVIEQDGSLGSYYEDTDEQANCAEWSRPVLCGNGFAASGVEAHFNPRDTGSEELVGLGLICRKIEKIYE